MEKRFPSIKIPSVDSDGIKDEGHKKRGGERLSGVFSQIMDLHRAIAKPDVKSPPRRRHRSRTKAKSPYRKGRGIKRFRRLVLKVVEINRLSKIKGHDMINSAQMPEQTDFSERLIDYFLIFETAIDSDAKGVVLKPRLIEHVPTFEHRDCQIQHGWTMMAFPRIPTISKKYRPPIIFYSVFTQPDGSRSYATFLQYDESLNHSMKAKLSDILEKSAHQTNNNPGFPTKLTRSPGIISTVLRPYSQKLSPLSPRLSPSSDVKSGEHMAMKRANNKMVGNWANQKEEGGSGNVGKGEIYLGSVEDVKDTKTDQTSPDKPAAQPISLYKINPRSKYGSIKVRKKPELTSKFTGRSVGDNYEVFAVDHEETHPSGQIFLRLADGSGWAIRNDPDDPKNKPIVLQVLTPSTVKNAQGIVMEKIERTRTKEKNVKVKPPAGDPRHKRSSLFASMFKRKSKSKNGPKNMTKITEEPKRGSKNVIKPIPPFEFRSEKRTHKKDRFLIENSTKCVSYVFNEPPLHFFSLKLDSYDDIIVVDINPALDRLAPHSQIVSVAMQPVPTDGSENERRSVELSLSIAKFPIHITFQVPYEAAEAFPLVEHNFEQQDIKGLADLTGSLYRPKVIALVSHYPLINEFHKILTDLFQHMHDLVSPSKPENLWTSKTGKDTKLDSPNLKPNSVPESPTSPFSLTHTPVEKIISMLVYTLPVPIPGRFGIEFSICADRWIQCVLPSVRSPFVSSISLREVFSLLSVENVLSVLSALLCEERVALHSHSLSKLTIVTQCLLQLLYPLSWTYTYIPLLPEEGLMALEQGAPYIIGVATDVFFRRSGPPLDGVYIVDLNQDKVATPPHVDEEISSVLSSKGVLGGECGSVSPSRTHSRWSSRTNSRIYTRSFLRTVALPQISHPSPSNLGTQTASLRSTGVSEVGDGPRTRLPTKYYKYLKKVFRIALQMKALDSDFVKVDDESRNHRQRRFDRQLYAAILHFYASLLNGYRRYLAFVDQEPFFNLEGFLASVKDEDTRKLLEHMIGSPSTGLTTSFYIFLTEDWLQGPLHDYIDAPSKIALNRIHQLELLDDDIFMYKITPDGSSPFHSQKRKIDVYKPPKKPLATSHKLYKRILYDAGHKKIEFDRSADFLFHCRMRKAKPLTQMWDDGLPAQEKLEFILIQIFSGGSLTENELRHLEKIFDSPEARERARSILTQPQTTRTTTCLGASAFQSLTDLCVKALEHCTKTKEFKLCVLVWEIAPHFVLELKDGTKLHLEEKLKDFSVWGYLDFWIEAAKLKAEDIRNRWRQTQSSKRKKALKKETSMSMGASSSKGIASGQAKRDSVDGCDLRELKKGPGGLPVGKLQKGSEFGEDEKIVIAEIQLFMKEWLPRVIYKMVESRIDKESMKKFLLYVSETHKLMEENLKELQIMVDKSLQALEALESLKLELEGNGSEAV
ncbi:hypothetical protein AAMO2058_000590500 [Amorphochlora amoebiformis]